jgi:hypothetical protein
MEILHIKSWVPTMVKTYTCILLEVSMRKAEASIVYESLGEGSYISQMFPNEEV